MAGDAHVVTTSRLYTLLERGGVDEHAEEVAAEELGDELLLFSVGDHRYAIATESVKAVVASSLITYLPGMPAYVVGVFNHHGKVTAALDLANFEGREPTGEAERMIVVESDGDLHAAFKVSGIDGIARPYVSEHKEPLPHLRDRAYVRSQLRNDNNVYTMLDAMRLLQQVGVNVGD